MPLLLQLLYLRHSYGTITQGIRKYAIIYFIIILTLQYNQSLKTMLSSILRSRFYNAAHN